MALLSAASKRSMYAGMHFTASRKDGSSGKESQPNIQPSTGLRIEPGTSGLGGRDLTTVPTPPPFH